MKKSVVIYARESNHAGAEGTLERQKENLKAFCQQKGYAIADEISTIGSRQDSLSALKEAIESAKNTEGKTLLMVSSNRVAGTISEMETIADLIEESGVNIATMDGSYELVQKHGATPTMLIANTLAAIDNELDEEDEG
jgi:DNA invertase Pin-like site-specific DNA recombinase